MRFPRNFIPALILTLAVVGLHRANRQTMAEGPPPDNHTGGGIGPVHQLPTTQPSNTARRIVFACALDGLMIRRLPLVKDELIKAVNGLRPIQSFDLIIIQGKTAVSFSSYAGNRGLVIATPESKKLTVKFLDGITAAGDPTDPAAGLEAAFKLKPQLIYLLTGGNFANNDAVISKIRVLNKEGNVKINTILLVDEDPKGAPIVETMKTIALENAGHLVIVRGEDIETPVKK